MIDFVVNIPAYFIHEMAEKRHFMDEVSRNVNLSKI